MQDRNVQFPQRYKLQKVVGTDDIYDLIPTPGEISSEGTFLNKANLLKDVTASLFGLGSEAVPDDVLTVLSRLHAGLGNEYVWEKSGVSYSPVWNTSTSTTNIATFTTATVQLTLYNSIVVSPDGAATLEDVYKTYEFTDKNILNVLSLSALDVGVKYFYAFGGYIYKTTPGKSQGNYNGTYFYLTDCTKLTGSSANHSFLGYVNSPDPTSYPPAVSDGFTYKLLGQLGQGMTKSEMGSYVGTGKYGSANPTSLTFSFAPKYVFLWSDNYPVHAFLPKDARQGLAIQASDNGTPKTFILSKTQTENTISWMSYNTPNAEGQMNGSGRTYYYMAIG